VTPAEIIFVAVVVGIGVLAWLGWWAVIYVRTMRGWVTDVIENPDHAKRLRKAALDIPVGVVEDLVKESVESPMQPRGRWLRRRRGGRF
jgi:hypothetical protein